VAGTNGKALMSSMGSLWTGAVMALGDMPLSHCCFVPLRAVEKRSIGITYFHRSFPVKSWDAILFIASMFFIVLG